VGITTAGPSLVYLDKHFPETFALLNDADVSFDSPVQTEHNENRGSNLFHLAIRCLELCQKYAIPHSIIMCGMNWNFTEDRIRALVALAKQYDAHIRINPLKPVEPAHMDSALTAEQYYRGFSLLLELCDPVDLGEPPLGTVTDFGGAKGCPCGRTSFRIHSVTPEGRIPVSPCVYLHDYKVGDLAKDDLYDIVRSPQFRSFRRRNAHPEAIPGCEGCDLIEKCRGGCAARSYLHHAHTSGRRSLFVRDPFCPKDVEPEYTFPQRPRVPTDQRLVHMDYLCTWIGKPR
jgi:radical SAM protein with 4Fe4S-binding SPASM domain